MTKKLYHEGVGSVSVAGKEYDVVDGVVEVPEEHAPHLMEAYGFTDIKPKGSKSKADDDEDTNEFVDEDGKPLKGKALREAKRAAADKADDDEDDA